MSIKFPDYCLWKRSCLRIVSRTWLYTVAMDQRKWTQIDVKKKKKNLSKTVLWCLNQDLSGYWAPWLRRIASLFGKSWQRSPRGKQWRRLSAKPNGASTPPGPCQPATPDGSLRPAKEPCLSLRKVGRSIGNRHFFPRLKLTAATLGPHAERLLIWGSRSALLLHGEEERSGPSGWGSRVWPRLASGLHHWPALRAGVS